jgi:hypothetical protein
MSFRKHNALMKICSGESLPILPWPHGSQGDAKHRPETREDALLAMRVWDLILRSIAKRCVSKDEAIEVEIALSSCITKEKSWLGN